MVQRLNPALFALALIWLQLPTSVQAQQQWQPWDSQPADARIRFSARNIVGDLEHPSCAAFGVPPGFDRAKALAPEKAAVEQFKARIRGSAAYFHFIVGETDARYEDKAQSRCWNDSETWIAERHVQDAKTATKARLEGLEKLAPDVRHPAHAPEIGSLDASAEFRFRVRQLIESSRPRCGLTKHAHNELISAPAKQAVAAFRRELEGTEYALHFDMAEGDVNLFHAISTLECGEEGSEPANYWTRRLVSGAEKQIARIRKMIGPSQRRLSQASKP